jgi:hypothetical protein
MEPMEPIDPSEFPDRKFHMLGQPVEIDLDETNAIFVKSLDVCIGLVIEPGHDCNREDHHVARSVPVIVFRVLDYDTDETSFLMFPKESSFISDLLDGTLRDELQAIVARFEQDNP